MGDKYKNHLVMAKSELEDLKKYVIGLLYLEGVGQFELVIKEKGDYLDTIAVTQFGVINDSYNVPKRFGVYHRFPGNKNMWEMLKGPNEWQQFINKFV